MLDIIKQINFAMTCRDDNKLIQIEDKINSLLSSPEEKAILRQSVENAWAYKSLLEDYEASCY